MSKTVGERIAVIGSEWKADRIGSRRDQLRAYEQVEWSRAEQDHWLAHRAYDGALRAVESGDPMAALRSGIRATSLPE